MPRSQRSIDAAGPTVDSDMVTIGEGRLAEDAEDLIPLSSKA